MGTSKETIEELGHNYTVIRTEEKELSERYKQLSDELKKLLAKRTIQ
jgi:Holliday junction resolvasome RuvABC endonuclease subunit